METALYIFCGTVVLTLIGWIVVTRNNHLLAIQRDRETRQHSVAAAKDGRKRDFRAAVSSVRDGFDTTPDDRLFETHQASVSRVRDECASIIDDIPEAGRDGFQRSRDAYLSLTRDHVENRDWSKKVPLATPPARYELGRARLRQLLEELIGCAKQ